MRFNYTLIDLANISVINEEILQEYRNMIDNVSINNLIRSATNILKNHTSMRHPGGLLFYEDYCYDPTTYSINVEVKNKKIEPNGLIL